MNENTRAKLDPVETESPTAHTYCTFQLQGGLFGIDALAVKEITVLPPLTPIPHAPGAVRGCVNLRGQIVLVSDMNCLLQTGESAIGPETRLVVFRAHLGDPFGILVDRIGNIVELCDEKIEKTANGSLSRENAGDSSPEALVAGIGKLSDKLLTILDAGKLLPHIEAAIVQSHKKSYH